MAADTGISKTSVVRYFQLFGLQSHRTEGFKLSNGPYFIEKLREVAWPATRQRWHMHFIPTYSSWLNQVERFFALMTGKAIRRGSVTSVKQPVQRIDHFVAAHNTKCQTFKWTATADSNF